MRVRSVSGGRRSSAARLVGEAVLPLLLAMLWLWHVRRIGLPDRVLYEAADAAGDMLQVDRALGRRWFVTGHHSDVGVDHPGPFALWLKAALGPLHGLGLGGSVYALAMSLFLGLRLAALALVARAFSRAAFPAFSRYGSLLVGWVAAGGVVLALTREGRLTGLDLQGSTIHYLSAWAVLVMLAGALAAAAPSGSPHLLVLGAGVTAHVHTPSFPLGVLGLLLAGFAIVRPGRRLSARSRVSAAALWTVFVAPLLVRVVLEPGFPVNYVAAARRRSELAASPAGRSSLDGLAGVLDFPAPVLFAGLLLPLMLAVLVRRRSLASAGVLAGSTLWSILVLAVSPPQERVATEVVWVSGVVLFSAAVVTALGAAAVFAAVRRVRVVAVTLRAVAGAVTGTVVLGVLVMTLLSVLPARLSTSGGGDGRHVPVMVDAIEKWSSGRRFALVFADPNWFSTSSGVLLELGRRRVDFCVSAGEILEERLTTFLDPSRLCDRSGGLPAVMVSWDAARDPAGSGASLVVAAVDGSTPEAVADPDDLLCSRMGAGGVCFASMPEGFVELVRTREPDEGAYGMVEALRLTTFPCSPHPFLACAELSRPAR